MPAAELQLVPAGPVRPGVTPASSSEMRTALAFTRVTGSQTVSFCCIPLLHAVPTWMVQMTADPPHRGC